MRARPPTKPDSKVTKPKPTLAEKVVARIGRALPIGVTINKKTPAASVDEVVKAIINGFAHEDVKIGLTEVARARGVNAHGVYAIAVNDKDTGKTIQMFPETDHMIGKAPSVIVAELANVVGGSRSA